MYVKIIYIFQNKTFPCNLKQKPVHFTLSAITFLIRVGIWKFLKGDALHLAIPYIHVTLHTWLNGLMHNTYHLVLRKAHQGQ